MKTTTTTGSVRKEDSSLDATLNPVELPSGEIVSWAQAFPRPALASARPLRELIPKGDPAAERNRVYGG
jgi:hypothetical protein